MALNLSTIYERRMKTFWRVVLSAFQGAADRENYVVSLVFASIFASHSSPPPKESATGFIVEYVCVIFLMFLWNHKFHKDCKLLKITTPPIHIPIAIAGGFELFLKAPDFFCSFLELFFLFFRLCCVFDTLFLFAHPSYLGQKESHGKSETISCAH